jgi:hypothetical protein
MYHPLQAGAPVSKEDRVMRRPAQQRKPKSQRWMNWVAAGSPVMVAAVASAQTGPLIMKPWDSGKPRWVETYDEISYIPGGHIKGSDDDIDVFYWDSSGRIKFDKNDTDPKFWMGYDILTIELGRNAPGLPGGFTDASVQGAFKLGEIGDGWDVTLAAGLGIASDNHLSDSNAIYGIATINAVKELTDTAKLNIGVSYDGNRTFLPDIPLPYAVYLDRLDRTFTYYVGVPATGFVWTPDDRWTLSASYIVPQNFTVDLAYEIIPDKLSLFGFYRNTLDAFWQHDSDHTRIFYEMSRVVAGLRWIWEPWIDLSVGGGYAFNQEFSTGWDSRDTDTLAEPSDEPMVYFNLRGTF